MSGRRGIVYLVGAGPGDPGLITVRGQALLQSADVVVYDRLIGRELLAQAKPNAELIDAGKRPGFQRLTQEHTNALLIDRARRGLFVVRLKGGDPFVFGRGYEELAACRESGVDCVVVPGVTSAIAGPAAAGIPVTTRGAARSFAVVTAEVASSDIAPPDYAAFAGVDTLVILMGRAGLRGAVDQLIAAGRDPSTPSACIERATTREQRVERATLATIADAVERAGLAAPMITVVGDVAGLPDVSCGVASRGLPARRDGIPPAAQEEGLAGKRIAVTRPRSAGRELQRRLLAAGAIPISLPMIRIASIEDACELDEAIGRLADYQWIVFNSIHAVRAFRKRLEALAKDARCLAGCRVAAIGCTTAKELARLGLRADVLPKRHTAAELARAIRDSGLAQGSRVLVPRGDLGGADICRELRSAGAIVEDTIAYRTEDATPSHPVLEEVRRGVDAILFFSPSAVRRFAALALPVGDAVIGCVGPATASAVADAGLPVGFTAEQHSAAGVFEALEKHFALTGAQT